MGYTVDAQIGYKLAMLGSRLIHSTAQSLAGQFFTKFAGLMKSAGQGLPDADLKSLVVQAEALASMNRKRK
jgi:Carbon monoxide dehydrogenase subunit G (CoxG)